MFDRLKESFDPLFNRFQSLPPATMFLLLGLLGSGIALAIVSTLWMNGSGPQGVLYAQLSIDDAAAVAAKLQEVNIPYTLRGDGTTIMVPSEMVHEARLQLATAGLPRGGGVGFELFDQRSFGMTEFMQKLNYQRALQGELARTIAQLAAVRSARVHVVLPKKSLFIDQQEKTTASVVLSLASGRRLTPEQIHGIGHLVASSVEGLSADEVTLVDSNGNRLSKAPDDGSGALPSAGHLSYQRALEQRLEERVQSLLARAVGRDNVLVRVSAALDFQRTERSEERYDADNPAIRSEQRTKEEGQGSGFWAVGVPGARSNVTNAPAAPPNDAKDKEPANVASRQSEMINYEVSKVVSKVVGSSGEIKRLSVAVLVDGSYQAGPGVGETVYAPRTAAELAQYQEIVKSAVGYDESRGDRVEISNIPFEAKDTQEAELMEAEAQQSFWLHMSRYGAYVLLGLLACLFIIRPMMKWLTASPDALETTIPRTVEELEAEMGEAAGLPAGSHAVGALPQRTEAETMGNRQLRQQVTQIVLDEPEQTAEILRLWLKA